MKRTLGTNRTLDNSIARGSANLFKNVVCLAMVLFAGMTQAAEITLSGINDVLKGKVYAQVLVDEPVTQVVMSIPDVLWRSDSSAPYSLNGDRKGTVYAWDTTRLADGTYNLTVSAKLSSGEIVSKQFELKIDNTTAVTQTTSVGIALDQMPDKVRVGQTLTIPTTGLADGTVVWYHCFDMSWGDLVRSNLTVQKNSLTFTIPDVSGKRRIQLQNGSYKTNKVVEVMPALVVAEPLPTPEPAPAPTTEPEVGPVTEPETAPITDPVITPLPDPFVVSFVDAPAEYLIGSGKSISLSSTGVLEEGADVLVAALSEVTGGVVGSFSFTLKGEPWVIPASKLDLIPAGQAELVLLVRDSAGTKVTHSLTVKAPAPVIPDPVIAFVDKPSEYLLGSGKGISFDVQNLPAGGDVLVGAWSIANGAMIDSFTHTLSKSPWTISSAMLDKLSAGDVELQLIVRGGEVRPKATLQLGVVAPVIEPTAEVTPEPAPQPTPEVVQMSFDMNAIPDQLETGQIVSVPVTGIAEGEVVYFHVFDMAWGNLVRSNVTVKNSKLVLLIPQVSGERILQLQYKSDCKDKKNVVVGAVVAEPTPEPTPVVEPAPAPTPDPTATEEPIDPAAEIVNTTTGDTGTTDTGSTQPAVDPSTIPTLQPGSGWSGATAAPGAVGNPSHPGYPYNAIARWAVVPQQQFKGVFTIGVAAFHSYGIGHVDFSVNNGPWVRVDQRITNPRTGVSDEYCVNLDASKFKDGLISVRAIAYPINGQPIVLEDLELFANAGGSLSFPVIELNAGVYVLSGLSDKVPMQGYLTVRPKPGVAKKDCIITQVSRVSSGGNLKLQGLTFKAKAGMDMCYGKETGKGMIWFDDVTIIGNGRTEKTDWLAHLWGRQIYTNCDISQVRSVFHGGGGGLFARNVYIHDIYEDTFRAMGYAANITLDGVDRGDADHHPDLFDFATGWTQSQIIFYNIKIRNAYSQGMAGGNMKDIAMVNCDIETPGWAVMQIGRDLNNVVFQNCRFQGGALLRDAIPNGVMIRDSSLGYQPPFLPENWNQPGVTVLPPPPLFD